MPRSGNARPAEVANGVLLLLLLLLSLLSLPLPSALPICALEQIGRVAAS